METSELKNDKRLTRTDEGVAIVYSTKTTYLLYTQTFRTANETCELNNYNRRTHRRTGGRTDQVVAIIIFSTKTTSLLHTHVLLVLFIACNLSSPHSYSRPSHGITSRTRRYLVLTRAESTTSQAEGVQAGRLARQVK